MKTTIIAIADRHRFRVVSESFICLSIFNNSLRSFFIVITSYWMLVYGLSFLLSVSASIKAQKLPRPAYELVLSNQEDGVFIRSLAAGKDESITLRWDSLHAIHRARGCIYLYAIPTKAFLLPDGQADASPDEVWAMITRNVST